MSELATSCPRCTAPNPHYAPPGASRSSGAGKVPGVAWGELGKFAAAMAVAVVVTLFALPRLFGAGQPTPSGGNGGSVDAHDVEAAFKESAGPAVYRHAMLGEAAPVLKQIRMLEITYRDQNGEFTRKLDDLKSVGWSDTRATAFTFRVSRARGDQLCVDALPAAARSGEMEGISIDAEGKLYDGPGCASSRRRGAPVQSHDSARAAHERAAATEAAAAEGRR